MSKYVIDASLIASAIFGEDHADHASQILDSGDELLAPDFVYIEVSSVIWKRFQRKEINQEKALALLDDIQGMPLDITSSVEIIKPALAVALHTGRSVYDCMYLALAIQNKCVMWTADRRLVNALATTPYKKHVKRLGN